MIENCSVILGQFSSRYISRDTACEKYFGNFLNFYRRCLWHVLRGGTSLYKPFRYVPPQRVRFLRRFGLESGIVFRRATVVYEHICRLVPNE